MYSKQDLNVNLRVKLVIPFIFTNVQSRHATRGRGHLRHFPPEGFKTLHGNFDICRNFQMIRLKFCILIIFTKSFT